MSIRFGLNSGVARHGIFSALVGPRIMLAPDEGGGSGGDNGGNGGGSGGEGAPAGGAGTGDAGKGDAGAGTGDPAKPAAEGKEPKSALAGAIDKAAAKPEGEGQKPEGKSDKVEGPDKVKPGEGDEKPKTPEEQAALDAAPKDIDGKPLPEKYEVKMPDGVEMDTELMKLADPVFREHKMSPTQAQAMTDLYTKQQERAISQHVEQTNNWLKESQKDPEIGGKEFDKNLAHASRAFQAFGSERAMQIFDTYGLGNNPEVLRIFVRMGKALGEGTTVLPGAEHGDVSTANVMYPSMTKK